MNSSMQTFLLTRCRTIGSLNSVVESVDMERREARGGKSWCLAIGWITLPEVKALYIVRVGRSSDAEAYSIVRLGHFCTKPLSMARKARPTEDRPSNQPNHRQTNRPTDETNYSDRIALTSYQFSRTCFCISLWKWSRPCFRFGAHDLVAFFIFTAFTLI